MTYPVRKSRKDLAISGDKGTTGDKGEIRGHDTHPPDENVHLVQTDGSGQVFFDSITNLFAPRQRAN